MHLMGEARNALRPPLTPQLFTPGADMDKIMAIGFRGHIKQAQERIDAIPAPAPGRAAPTSATRTREDRMA